MILCWNFQHCRFSRHTFFTLARKNYCLSKIFQNFNIFWSGNVPLIRYCLQLFPKPHRFLVILCWNLKKKSIFRYLYTTFDIYFLLKKIDISQMYISCRSFLLNTNFWSSIAIIKKNGILLNTCVYPRGIWLYFICIIFFFIG